MRVRKSVALAAAMASAVGLVWSVAPAQAGEVEVQIPMTCVGDDSVLPGTIAGNPAVGGSQGIVNLLGTLAGTGATTLSVNLLITPTVPDMMGQGETEPTEFHVSTALDQDTIDSAVELGIPSIGISNQTYSVLQTGGTPEEIVVTPPDTSIDLTASPIVYPEVDITGDVTSGVDDTAFNILYQVGQVKIGVTVPVATLGGDVALGINCSVTEGTENLIAETQVEGGVDPSTTTSTVSIPPTTTTSVAAETTTTAISGRSTPRYTG